MALSHRLLALTVATHIATWSLLLHTRSITLITAVAALVADRRHISARTTVRLLWRLATSHLETIALVQVAHLAHIEAANTGTLSKLVVRLAKLSTLLAAHTAWWVVEVSLDHLLWHAHLATLAELAWLATKPLFGWIHVSLLLRSRHLLRSALLSEASLITEFGGNVWRVHHAWSLVHPRRSSLA